MGAKVVVIEDDRALLRLLDSILRSSDMEPVLFTNAEDALEWLPAERPEVVVCDLSLPGMRGVAFVEILRPTALAGTPLLLMSAYGEPKQHSADIFLGKPFDPVWLSELVERMARAARRSDASRLIGALAELPLDLSSTAQSR